MKRDPKQLFSKIKEACPLVLSFTVHQAKDLWGFQNNETQEFMRLNFSTLANMRQCDYALRRKLSGENTPLRVYEANIEPVLRLLHRSNIQSTGWLNTGDCSPGSFAKTDVDLFQNDWRKLKPVARDDIAPFIIASFDIETNSSTGKFPEAEIEGDSVFQIAVTLKKQGRLSGGPPLRVGSQKVCWSQVVRCTNKCVCATKRRRRCVIRP